MPVRVNRKLEDKIKKHIKVLSHTLSRSKRDWNTWNSYCLNCDYKLSIRYNHDGIKKKWTVIEIPNSIDPCPKTKVNNNEPPSTTDNDSEVGP